CVVKKEVSAKLYPVRMDFLDDIALCPGTPITVDGGQGSAHMWSPENYSSRYYTTDKGGKISLTLLNAYGCWETDSFEIKEICEPIIFVPNAFSPNNDGTNEYFNILALYLDDFHLSIYDRWGELIFESNSVDNTWNGTY